MSTTSKITFAAVAVALLSACTSQGQGGGTPSGSAPSVPARSQTPSPVASAAPESPAAASGPAACASADLAVALTPDQGGGGMNQTRLVLAFTNRGAVECALQGSPGVSFVTGDGGTQVGAPATREADGGPAVTLLPGASATSTLAITNADVFDPAECAPADVRGLRVYPPGETAAVFVEQQRKACSAPEKSTMVVGPVQG
ncbi:DUF4232 domain-containing protein [Umezawaea endophytica]|uniref:DUF4232 domain-containing protein n=1 Tax=Umezawaea endophytica TaxID=1654476 RepID=A0A9X2VR59_9PSEU|nr:DUF4232 domain-containing protein [Umezawaea endophytica]MCS7481220.1 DUF4232 domain-containing protein [Umezawaea endophytica]